MFANKRYTIFLLQCLSILNRNKGACFPHRPKFREIVRSVCIDHMFFDQSMHAYKTLLLAAFGKKHRQSNLQLGIVQC